MYIYIFTASVTLAHGGVMRHNVKIGSQVAN